MSYSNLDLSVLKVLVTNKSYAIDFVNDCDSKLFSPEVWSFANLVINYIKSYKEIPTLRVLTEKLSKGNNEKLIENTSKIWEAISNFEYDEKEYKHDLEKIKKRFAEKQITSVKDALIKLEPGLIDIPKTVGEMQKTIQTIKSLNQPKAYESKNIKEFLPFFVEKFNLKKQNPDLEVGVKTKYSFFDFATNGVKPADFVLIAGESGFGKSLFLNNIAIQTWMQDNKITQKDSFTEGKNIIYFSLEMPYEDCFNRLISRLSGVPARNIENAKISKEDFAKIKQALDFINNYPYTFKIVDIADASANDLEAILANSEEKFDVVFVDYLGIMNTNEKSDEADWLKQGLIAYEVRAIARKYKLPIFSAVQLNRKSQSKDSSENIGLSRLARSSTIATHATHVIQIENRPQEEMHPDFVWHIIKNRKGPKGKGVLYKNLACATLIDKPMEVEEQDSRFTNYDMEDISEEIEDLEI
jgi:replicative DNA helicase